MLCSRFSRFRLVSVVTALTITTLGVVATGGCKSSSDTPGCTPERSTTELVAFIPNRSCDGGADGGACPDDTPPVQGTGEPSVAEISTPFCQRHCAAFPYSFLGCSVSSTPASDGGRQVDCIPVGCN